MNHPLRSIAIAAALAVPIVALTPSPVSAGLSNCTTYNGGYWGQSACQASSPPYGGQQRVRVSCWSSGTGQYTVWGSWRGVGQISSRTCSSGGNSVGVWYELSAH